MNTLSLSKARADRVSPADRIALAYLYNKGPIKIGPGTDHASETVRALVHRLHPLGLVRGNVRARTLAITDEGSRVVEHWIEEIECSMSPKAIERVLDSLRWIGAPTLPIDAELEARQLVRRIPARPSGKLHFMDFTWRTDLCVAVAQHLQRTGT